MKKILIIALTICSFVSLPALCMEGIPNSTQTKQSFFKRNPIITRALIIGATALEALAINSQIEFLGIGNPANDSTASGFIAHNLANSFPTVAKLCGIPIDQYTAQGPIVHATNIPALAAISGLWAQNHFLSTYLLDNQDKPTFRQATESFLLTAAGYITAWGIRFAYGALSR